MRERNDHISRRAIRAIPSYEDPALSQILQSLSELPSQEALKPMSKRTLWSLQSGATMSINKSTDGAASSNIFFWQPNETEDKY